MREARTAVLRSRGGSIAPLPMVRVQAAFVQQGAVVRDHRTLPVGKIPNDFELAYYHAPIHYQDTDSSNYRADYITRFDYDGNMVASDNWENLTKFPQPAHAYFSVVETCTHWYIAYGFFHPRDWTDSSMDQEHENDMEGLLTIVRKDGSPYGKLEGIITVFHLDFFSFTPPGSPFRNGHENIDGTLTLQQYEGSWRPLTVQQAKGHGLKAFPFTSDFQGKPNQDGDHLLSFAGRRRSPTSAMIGTWITCSSTSSRQADCGNANSTRHPCPATKLRPLPSGVRSKVMAEEAVAPALPSPAATDSPHPPWGWDDHDDGPTYVGEMGLDPAHLVAHYFTGLGNFSMKYLRNRYASDLKARGYRHGNVPRGWSEDADSVRPNRGAGRSN